MGKIKYPPKVKIFASIIFNERTDLSAVFSRLEGAFGAFQDRTPPEVFRHTTYYNREMGEGLQRFFILFASLYDRDRLPDIKIATNAIEDAFSLDESRTVNIDSGYVALEHVILATTKGYAHRVYLGQGIYADLTLMFNNGSYRVLEWTYPDYAEPETIALFNGWREIYKIALKGGTETK